MVKKVLLGVSAVGLLALAVFAVWYLRLTAEVTVSDTPPVAATMAVPTTTPSAKVYRVDPSRSQASYAVDELFFDVRGFVRAVGTTQAVAGDIVVDHANLAESRVGQIVVDISQLTSDDPNRDRAIRNEWLESARYPLAIFNNARVHDAPLTWSEGLTFTLRMSGDLTVRTTTQPVTWDVEARMEGDTLYAKATTLVKMTQFGFQPPSLAVLRVEDDVTLTLDLVAPAVAPGETTPVTTPP